jgi:SAM-dependent methyltransferase
VTGVDLSEEMLELAAEKVPGVPLYRGDMTKVDLGQRFDVVICVFDSINHLLRFEEWKQVFTRAHAHLNENGLFVFDVNTQRRLVAFAEERAFVEWFGDENVMLVDVTKAGRGIFVWEIRIFERVGDEAYRLHEEDIREISFPAERIKAALEKLFSRVWVYDASRSRPTANSERLHFVCRA